MKKILFALLLVPMSVVVHAQSTVKDSIHYSVQQEPEFPGGQVGFLKYIAHVVRYPSSAYKQHITGRVFVQMTIEKNGSVTDAKIVRSVSPDLDAEALRVVNSSPKWKPGINNGIAVRVNYTVAINFSPDEEVQTTDTVKADTAKYVSVDQVPEFPGGMEGFYHYLVKNLKYPPVARDGRIEGRVIITFVVEKDGSLSDIKAVRSLSKETDEEAVRLMTRSPKWKPGIQNGKPVRVQYSLPISFSLGN